MKVCFSASSGRLLKIVRSPCKLSTEKMLFSAFIKENSKQGKLSYQSHFLPRAGNLVFMLNPHNQFSHKASKFPLRFEFDLLQIKTSIVESYRSQLSLMFGRSLLQLHQSPISYKSKQTCGEAVTILLFMRF